MDEWRGKNCLNYKKKSGVVKPQQVVEALYKVTGGDAFITSDVGQHQMWAAQYYKFNKPRRWINSGGLGTMGFWFTGGGGRAIGASGRASRLCDGRSKHHHVSARIIHLQAISSAA